ncbi:uncharacterized protein [Prorops nasuta]|uniref:uncharacterized protein n=1 Tax=Prorops nasuta TaxID=863751 RepID=UPI0034CE913D
MPAGADASYNWSLGQEQESRLEIAINELLYKGAVVRCLEVEGQVLSPYFLVKKPNGKDRFILNLKFLNQFVAKEHFKMEDLRTAVALTFPKDFIASIDLKDAYFLIALSKESRKYVRFRFRDSLFEFTCLPFGLSSAPYIFTKLLKVPIRVLRGRGFKNVIYLDDCMSIEHTFDRCSENVKHTKELFESLGFIINYRKSRLIPSQQGIFLGMSIDTVKYCISLPTEKRKQLTELVEKFLHIKSCTIRNFAHLIGKLVAACPAVEYAWMYTKNLEKEKIFQLIMNDYKFDRRMSIPELVIKDLRWWKQNLPVRIHYIKDGYYDRTIYTDASSTGWGATDGTREIFGIWSDKERNYHINYLELLTVKIALFELASKLRNVQILLRVDNTTALSYLNKMGAVRVDNLGTLARKIWQWAEQRDIILFTSYIASAENTIADKLSRISQDDIEWELNGKWCQIIIETFGIPSIDLFASAKNRKCEKFVSWIPQKNAYCIDAFTLNWSNEFFYAFPPFALILKMLVKIKRENATGIIVVPLWRNQPWFPILEEIGEDTSASATSSFDCRQSVQTAFLNRGLPREALTILLASVADSTLKQYACALKQWDEFCNQRSISFTNTCVANVLSFLTERFERGASYGTLNSFRSAISLISQNKIGEHLDISRFMKGVYRLRPSRPKYAGTWDVAIVLDYLEALNCDNLTNLTYKTLMLLALGTAQRAQTLSFIKISNIRTVDRGLIIKIPELIKTSAAGREQPLLQLPRFIERPDLCVVSSITKYIERTRSIRKNIDNLFISLRSPYKAVGADSIGRWLKKTLNLCGIDTDIFTGHSTRHAAGSRADERGINVDTIRRTAGWSERSLCFAKFYKRPILSEGFEFARNVLQN